MAKRVMVAMSGGVDSSVAALLLKEQGYDVIGVTMCFSASAVYPGRSASRGNVQASDRKKPGCCGLIGIEDARRVARDLNIPHYVLNFAKELEEILVLDFIVEYTSGRTPNPCVRCNQYLKFGKLLAQAKAMGLSRLATGHYARIEKDKGVYVLKKGRDQKKDQSYFLCQMRRADLPRILMPLGGLTKDEVRDIAAKKGLAVAQKPGSQEICFVPDNDYRAFLKTRLNRAYFRTGDIVDREGRILGHHKGIFNYTIGQRGGLGISAAQPLYVVELDEKRNRVVVGSGDDVFSSSLSAVGPNWLINPGAKKTIRAEAKIRYNHSQVPVTVRRVGRSKLQVDFRNPERAVTPGQFVVFYDKDVVLGGAKIVASHI